MWPGFPSMRTSRRMCDSYERSPRQSSFLHRPTGRMHGNTLGYRNQRRVVETGICLPVLPILDTARWPCQAKKSLARLGIKDEVLDKSVERYTGIAKGESEGQHQRSLECRSSDQHRGNRAADQRFCVQSNTFTSGNRVGNTSSL